ncbi:SMI1/KNR4 family protein [Actinoplanes sp. G11-F43]|uniref:SMI1/KNR4 family protein n=1 Tax=Actinoplanes sp. G11-F43 TaxID=3424130 RepID=UPI003D330E37
MTDVLFKIDIPKPPEPPVLWSDNAPRLSALAAAPASPGDRWTLEPPLTTTELADLESQLGLVLPADYRAFLLQAGRGGAGPGHGLFPLSRASGRWRWTGGGAADRDSTTLTRPFAHIRAFNPLDTLPTDLPDDDERYFDLLYDPAHTYGLLYLCDVGCGLREVLVLSGPSRGQMWADYTAESDGFHPLQNPDGSRMSFTDWYRTWLTTAEHRSA